MYTASALAAVLAAAQAVSAFQGTYPVVAWSSERLTALSQLSPSASSSASSRSPSSSNQQTFSTPVESSDLCSLSTLLVLSAPGLHYSDLSLLPSASASPSGIKSALAHFGKEATEGTAATHPYAPVKGANRAAQLVRRFVGECGAVVQQEGEANVWAGEEGKTVRIVKVEGLEEWELVGLEAREGRKQVMSEIDTAISSLTAALPSPFAVILTSLPSTFSPSHPVKKGKCPHAAAAAAKKAKLAKRQAVAAADAAEEEYVEELLDEIAKEDALDDMIEKMEEFEESQNTAASSSSEEDDTAAPVVSDEYTAEGSELGVTDVAEQPATVDELAQEEALADESYDEEYSADAWAVGEGSLVEVSPFQKNGSEGNGTSIFQPKEGAGLLHRYVFFTPALIFAFLVSLLVLIPILLIGTQALLSIETVQGLETKMTGSVGLDASKQ